MRTQGDEFYLGLLDELAELHLVKSGGYGTPDDPLANFVTVAEFAQTEEWWYPLERALEKLARVRSLRAQGRIAEIGLELPEIASLVLCAEALRRRSDLIGPEALAKGPYVAPCAQASEASQVVHAAHTPCKSPVFRSDAADAEVLRRRVEAAGVEGYERRRTASAVADDESARLRDAQQGDDGWVRA